MIDWTPLLVIKIIGILIGGHAYYNWRYPTHPDGRGAARWLTLDAAVRSGKFIGYGLIVGDWSRWIKAPIYFAGVNAITVGPPGSMKGVGALIPNSLRSPFMFLYDPGGETSAICVKEWRRQGYNIHCINPWAMHSGGAASLPASGFNPMDILNVKSSTFASDALLLATNVVERSKNPDHWEKKGFGSYQKLFMHCKISEPHEKQNLNRIRQYVRGSMEDWVDLIKSLTDSPNEAVRGLGNEWLRMMAKSPKEFSGIISTMESATIWLDDDVMKGACK